jgi:hypothetical protein
MPVPLLILLSRAQSAVGTELSRFFIEKNPRKKDLTKNGDHHLKEQDEIFSAVYRLPK